MGVGIASSSTGSRGGVITDVQQILAAIAREVVVVQSMQLAWFMGAELWRRQTGVRSNLHICTCRPASRHQMGLCEDHAARWFASCLQASRSAPAWVASATPASIVNPRSDVSFGRRGLMWVGRFSEFWIPSQGHLYGASPGPGLIDTNVTGWSVTRMGSSHTTSPCRTSHPSMTSIFVICRCCVCVL